MKYEITLPFTVTVSDENEKYCDFECDGIRDYEYCAFFDSGLYLDETKPVSNYFIKRCKECVNKTNELKLKQKGD